MKELNSKNEIVAYAASFVSFILPKIQGVKEIVLFGSVTRGEADKGSDIDLFFDIEDNKKEGEIKELIKKEIKKFYNSKIAEVWFLKGIKNPININVGRLEEWKLKRSIISEGIVLYGQYKEIPAKMKKFVYFNINTIKDISKRNRIIRKLFGRKETNYATDGLINNTYGKKLTPTSFIVSQEHAQYIIKLLGEEKINYKLFEFWTDQIV